MIVVGCDRVEEMVGNDRLLLKFPVTTNAKSGGIGPGFNKCYSCRRASVRRVARPTTHPGDAGASPWKASVLAAV